MSKHKFMAWALVVALCLGLLPATALATDFEAVGSATGPMTEAEMCENIRRVFNGSVHGSYQLPNVDENHPYYEALYFCENRGYIHYIAGELRQDEVVDRATLARCLVDAGCVTPDVDSVECLDIAGAWAEKDIKQLLALKIMATDEDGCFRPWESAVVSDVDWAKVKSICNPNDTPHIIDLPKLPIPTDLEWNVSYRIADGSENKITNPGYVAWKTNAEVNCNARVKVYHKGIGDEAFTEVTPHWYVGGSSGSSGGGGSSAGENYVWEHRNRWILNYLQDRDKKLIPGTYYFTVQTYTEGYQDSEIATSPQWICTDQGKALPTPSDLTWNGTTLTWTMEGDAEWYDVELYFSETKDDETSIDDLWRLGEPQIDIDERELDLDDWFLDYLIGWGELYIYARVRACTADFNVALNSEWSELSPACHYVDDRSLGYGFIRSNQWTVDPLLEGTYQVETIVSTDGQPTTMRVTESLKDAIAKDSMILSDSRDYVGHFFAIGDIENGAVSKLEPVRDLQDITGMGDGVITLQNAAYSYDKRTRFIYVDMGWTDGDDPDNMIYVCEPDRDKIAFLESGQFNPEGFFDALDVSSDPDLGAWFSSVRAAVIERPADHSCADYVYVLRTEWWPAPDPGPAQPSQSAQPSAPSSASPEPSASSEPSANPSAAPSDSPSPSPSTKPSSSSGSSGSRRPAATVPAETPTPTPSQPPVEPSEVPVTPASELFSDVVKGSWYEPGVTYVVIHGLFKGMDVGVFSPDTNMTRAMVMTVLARMDGQDTTNATNGPWHTNIMNWAKAKGISDGTMPDSSVTREQLVTLLYRYAKPAAAAGDLTAFADGHSVSAWAERAMVWAVKQEIITGKNGGRLDPQGFATRAEVATIFQRFAEKTQPQADK